MPEAAQKPEFAVTAANESHGNEPLQLAIPSAPYLRQRRSIGLLIDNCNPGVFSRAQGEACQPSPAFAQHQLETAIAEVRKAQQSGREAQIAQQRHEVINRAVADFPLNGMQTAADLVHLNYYAQEQDPRGALVALGLVPGPLGRGARSSLNPGLLGRIVNRLLTGKALRLPFEGAPIGERVEAALILYYTAKYEHLRAAESALYRGISGTERFSEPSVGQFVAQAMQLEGFAGTALKVENPITHKVELLRSFVKYEQERVSVVVIGETNTVVRLPFSPSVHPAERESKAFTEYFAEAQAAKLQEIRGALAELSPAQLEEKLGQLVGKNGRNLKGGDHGVAATDEAKEVVDALNRASTATQMPLRGRDGSVRETVSYFLHYQQDGKIVAVVSDSRGPSFFHTFEPEYLVAKRDQIGMNVVHEYMVREGWIAK